MSVKAKAFYCICVLILVWFVASTLEVWLHNFKGNDYHKGNVWLLMTNHTTDMVVVGCKGNHNDDYEIMVQDIKGNVYAYIDTEPKLNGDVLRITINGNEIINARR